jgi:hypothetical protein
VSKTVTRVDTSLSGLSIVEISMAGMNARLDGEMGTEYLTPVSRAVLTDALGDAITLMRADHQYFVEENGRTVIKKMKMSVVVRSYELYAPEDVDGVTVTEDMVGSRKGEGTVLETVTFGANGYSAYSDRIPGNIMPEGILDAQTFIYNSLAMQILWDVGNADGAYSTIGANTIYWKIGALQNTEVTMTYYAYLTGSVEGTRETGEYALSKGTAVVYDGWTGNACWQTVEIPSVSWTQSTEKNGVYGDYFYVDGVRQKPYRLFEYDGHYYFVNDGDRIAKNVAQYIFPHSLDGVTLPTGLPSPRDCTILIPRAG